MGLSQEKVAEEQRPQQEPVEVEVVQEQEKLEQVRHYLGGRRSTLLLSVLMKVQTIYRQY